MNTFVSTSTGFSPYELVFLKKPPDVLNLYFAPTHKDILQMPINATKQCHIVIL